MTIQYSGSIPALGPRAWIFPYAFLVPVGPYPPIRARGGGTAIHVAPWPCSTSAPSFFGGHAMKYNGIGGGLHLGSVSEGAELTAQFSGDII